MYMRNIVLSVSRGLCLCRPKRHSSAPEKAQDSKRQRKDPRALHPQAIDAQHAQQQLHRGGAAQAPDASPQPAPGMPPPTSLADLAQVKSVASLLNAPDSNPTRYPSMPL
jgi:hypothetical protein